MGTSGPRRRGKGEYAVRLEWRGEEWEASVLEIGECRARGRTEAEAVEAVRAELALHVDDAATATLDARKGGEQPSGGYILDDRLPDRYWDVDAKKEG